MSHKFSVTRGLVQLKRLEQRINKKIDILEEFVVANKVSSTKVKDGLYTKDQFTAKAKSEWDSLNDLISLRKEIKDAIVQSNAKTKVIICGREYTIAQAIERKNAIQEFELPMVVKMSKALSSTLEKVETANDRVEFDAHRLFGTNTGDEKTELNRINMIQTYIDVNGYEVIDPLNFNEKSIYLDKEIKDFLSEVDQVLSEKNATTMITISKNPMDI